MTLIKACGIRAPTEVLVVQWDEWKCPEAGPQSDGALNLEDRGLGRLPPVCTSSSLQTDLY